MLYSKGLFFFKKHTPHSESGVINTYKWWKKVHNDDFLILCTLTDTPEHHCECTAPARRRGDTWLIRSQCREIFKGKEISFIAMCEKCITLQLQSHHWLKHNTSVAQKEEFRKIVISELTDVLSAHCLDGFCYVQNPIIAFISHLLWKRHLLLTQGLRILCVRLPTSPMDLDSNPG